MTVQGITDAAIASGGRIGAHVAGYVDAELVTSSRCSPTVAAGLTAPEAPAAPR